MRKVANQIIFTLVLLSVPFSIEAAYLAKVVVKVVDEENRPVEGAQVEIDFDKIVGCRTNSEGICSLSSPVSDGRVLGDVVKEGFYNSGLAHSFFKQKFGRWQPWEKEITVIMRPIINQVPMYISDKWIPIPELDKWFGFDLMKSDWVMPYGKGEISDVNIKSFKSVNAHEIDSKLFLKFKGQNDGIMVIKDDLGGIYGVGSIFRLPRIAPLEGYQPNLERRIYQGPGRMDPLFSEENNYIFRIRSEADEQGTIAKGMYGKIIGDIKYAPLEGKAGEFKMRYYLNPDGTRNLEFDPERNLFRAGVGPKAPVKAGRE